MKPKKERPIAILTINEDVSKMNKKDRTILLNWIGRINHEIFNYHVCYGKCRFRLMKGKGK